MPGTQTVGSLNIALLDLIINGNLCDGKFYMDVSPSIYIADGEDNVLGVKFEIKNPYGVIVKPYSGSYEVSPALSGGMDAQVSFNIPTQAGNYQYGIYTVTAELTDADGTKFYVSKTIKLCEPDKNNKTRNYGTLSALMSADCKNGKLYVILDNVPTYNGIIAQSQTVSGTLSYPTESELAPASIAIEKFSATLFEGVYKVSGEICALYNYGDNVFVQVKYKYKKEHHARCLIDKCCIYNALVRLHESITEACTEEEKSNVASITVDAIRLLHMIELAAVCGEDPSDYIASLEKLLGCKCTCNCAEGTPVIEQSPSSDVIVEGCNVLAEQTGNTTKYTINNYSYLAEHNANGGVLTVSSQTTEGCVVKQIISFNISPAYDQIKNLANASNSEADFWGSVINKSLRDLSPTCIGLTNEQWNLLSLPGKISAIFSYACQCCGTCDADIIDPSVSQSGNDVILVWGGAADSYEVYLDGVLVASQLLEAKNNISGEFTHIFYGAADGQKHTWRIVSYCDEGTKGDVESGEFVYLGCPSVTAPVLIDVINGGSVTENCPFDLTSLEDGSNVNPIEWHNANNTLPSSIVENPASVNGGVYYAFAKSGNCYSPGVKVTLICNVLGSCTAPQNLEVVAYGGYTNFVRFQSAAYPPASYTVKRRLATDPDVDGSYTTIGTPTWNTTLNRWVIADTSAVNNTVYIYKAISNCVDTSPSVTYMYAYVICSTVTMTPADESAGYSFNPIVNAVEITIQLFDESGMTLIKTDTYTPLFPSPITGTFEYLTPGTTYRVRVSAAIDAGAYEYNHVCQHQFFETTAP